MHGTKVLPEHMRYGPRHYNENYNQMGAMMINDIMANEYTDLDISNYDYENGGKLWKID